MWIIHKIDILNINYFDAAIGEDNSVLMILLHRDTVKKAGFIYFIYIYMGTYYGVKYMSKKDHNCELEGCICPNVTPAHCHQDKFKGK